MNALEGYDVEIQRDAAMRRWALRTDGPDGWADYLITDKQLREAERQPSTVHAAPEHILPQFLAGLAIENREVPCVLCERPLTRPCRVGVASEYVCRECADKEDQGGPDTFTHRYLYGHD